MQCTLGNTKHWCLSWQVFCITIGFQAKFLSVCMMCATREKCLMIFFFVYQLASIVQKRYFISLIVIWKIWGGIENVCCNQYWKSTNYMWVTMKDFKLKGLHLIINPKLLYLQRVMVVNNMSLDPDLVLKK